MVTQIDFESTIYEKAIDSEKDLPIKHVEIGYWPLKGAFFYFVKGHILLKHDTTADTTDTCDPETLR